MIYYKCSSRATRAVGGAGTRFPRSWKARRAAIEVALFGPRRRMSDWLLLIVCPLKPISLGCRSGYVVFYTILFVTYLACTFRVVFSQDQEHHRHKALPLEGK